MLRRILHERDTVGDDLLKGPAGLEQDGVKLRPARVFHLDPLLPQVVEGHLKRDDQVVYSLLEVWQLAVKDRLGDTVAR